MKFKLIVAFVDDRLTDTVIRTARQHGATGATIIPTARGEGMEVTRGMFGLMLGSHRNILLFIVEQHMSRQILEKISEAGEFDQQSGTGMALQLDVEDAVGLSTQVQKLAQDLGNKI